MRLHDIEPPAGIEQVVPLTQLIRGLLDRPRSTTGAFLLAVDGRSSNGKSTIAARIAAAVPDTAVVHTDDVAWWHSRFGWDDLLVTGIIDPLRRSEAVSYRPPAWDKRGRPGSIPVSSAAKLVVIEGVGAGRRSLRPLLDAVIWVQSDLDMTEQRNEARVDAGEIDPVGYQEWMGEETPFQASERTWERADIVVAGSPEIDHDPAAEVVTLR